MLIAGFTTAYDRSSNKAYERALHAEERSSLYEPIDTDGNVVTSYDSLDRLRQYQRGTLSRAGGMDAAGGGFHHASHRPGSRRPMAWWMAAARPPPTCFFRQHQCSDGNFCIHYFLDEVKLCLHR